MEFNKYIGHKFSDGGGVEGGGLLPELRQREEVHVDEWPQGGQAVRDEVSCRQVVHEAYAIWTMATNSNLEKTRNSISIINLSSSF